VTQLPDKRTWNATDGVVSLKRFAGTADAIRAKFAELASSASVDDVDETIDGEAGELLARVIEDSGSDSGGNTEALNAVWELYASPVYKPIEAHTAFDSITPERKRAIEKAAKDASTITLTGTAEKYLYGCYGYQILDFLLTELELRKSIILSTRSEITASYTNMNRVVTLASIDPPSALLGTLTSLPKMGGTSGAWEWLKLCPQLRQVAKRKFQLSYSWRGAERWLTLYGGTWNPSAS
jgi:hypothetical protein